MWFGELTSGGGLYVAPMQNIGVDTSPGFASTGLTGATSGARFVGATASGAPASGTFKVGDFCIDQTGKIFVCTVAGTSGTWVNVSSARSPTAVPTGMQSLTASSDNILTGSVAAFAAGDIEVGTCYEWNVQLIKTAAGVATWSMNVRVGTTAAGTTTDTSIATWTSGTNTAAIDQSTVRVVARCTSITTGSATFACAAYAQNELTTATGLGLFATPIPGSTATCTVSTAQSIHLDVTPGASAVMTAISFVARVQ